MSASTATGQRSRPDMLVVTLYRGQLSPHHRGEDELLFPVLRSRKTSRNLRGGHR